LGVRTALTVLFSLLFLLATLPVAPAGGQSFAASKVKPAAKTLTNQDVISLVSRNSTSTDSGNGESSTTAISADGRFIVFTSSATNLVPTLTDTNGAPDVFVYDRLNDFTDCLSRGGNSNFTANGASGLIGTNDTLGITADGQYVVYASQASDIVPLDNNGFADVFIVNRSNRTTFMVSTKHNVFTEGGNGPSSRPVISADGRIVVFVSAATNLSATNDTNGKVDVYARTLNILVTSLVSVNAAGTNGGNDHSSLNSPPSISNDGRFIAFDSQAGDLVWRIS
jgi:Tol biopolymer transport system component